MAGLKKTWNRLTDGPIGYIIYAVLGILIAFLVNQGLALALDTDLPVVAVVSNSMTHDSTIPQVHYKWLQENMNYTKSYVDSWPVKDGFLIGDLPIIAGSEKYNVGDVIVYSIKDQSVPIIHRIVKINSDGSFMTKGDHNSGLLSFEQNVKSSQVHGKVIFIVPKLGYFKVAVSKILGGI